MDIYPLTVAGAQWVYIGLSLLFWDLAFLCAYSLGHPQPGQDVSKGGKALLIALALGMAALGVAYTLTIAITGAQPSYPREVLTPFIRLAYWVAFVALAPPVVVGTVKTSKLMLGIREEVTT